MINSLNSNLNYDYNTSNFKQDKNIDLKSTNTEQPL